MMVQRLHELKIMLHSMFLLLGKFAYAGTAVTSTAAELNIVDGGTSATSTTVADADRVVMNDNGTMVQVAVTDLAAYFDDEITAMPNLASVGTLTALTVDDVAVDGKVITMTGSSSDTAVFTAGTNGTLSDCYYRRCGCSCKHTNYC